MSDSTKDETDFGRGYDGALADVEQWIDDTIRDWISLKIVTDNQAIWLKELAHEFALRFLYERRVS